MTTMRYLLLVVTLACFVGGGLSVTDQEFQDLLVSVGGMRKEIKDLYDIVENQAMVIRTQASTIEQMQMRDTALTERVEHLSKIIASVVGTQQEMVQNTTIEERVELLEIQVADLDQDVNFLFDEQVIQDERLLNLKEDTDQINEQLVLVDEDIEGLQVATLELEFRVTTLEENGGSDGNSSISELEERVETLEGTAAGHETRLTSAESEIEDLGAIVADHETRLTSAEENIQGLQMTDISHDTRITALEENGGGGSGSQNETIAFYAVLTSYDTIPVNAVVEFNEIVMNEGNGYDSTTGVFTVPPGGSGLYYFSTYVLVDEGEFARLEMMLNNDPVCSVIGDHSDSGSDNSQASCSAVVSVEEGDEAKVVMREGDDTPLRTQESFYWNGFNGFRI